MNKNIRRGLGALVGLGVAALSIRNESCCVRPETIAETARMQDTATAELCNSLDLQNESARIQEECRNAYMMLNSERSASEEWCGSGYEQVRR
ncbi:MAG: hypothetical protein QME12_01405 [Nanoarchaeota archaeon]|nr:hypothetical protein [Nanoarchaeota archaeon]